MEIVKLENLKKIGVFTFNMLFVYPDNPLLVMDGVLYEDEKGNLIPLALIAMESADPHFNVSRLLPYGVKVPVENILETVFD